MTSCCTVKPMQDSTTVNDWDCEDLSMVLLQAGPVTSVADRFAHVSFPTGHKVAEQVQPVHCSARPLCIGY